MDQNEWFQVETQMNRGPDSKLVDKDLVSVLINIEMTQCQTTGAILHQDVFI